MPDESEGTAESLTTSHSLGDFFIGLGISLGAACLNAFGLNLTKLDHAKASAIPRAKRRKEFLRPLWLLGMFSYIISQLVGSTLALEFLRSEYVAPLGASSLIFNVLFARVLVHTKITKLDIIGTLVIIIGVVGVVAFGNQRSLDGPDTEANLDKELLQELWGKTAWIVYFVLLELLTSVAWWLASISDEVLKEREEVDDDHERPDEDRYIRGGGGRKQLDPNASSFFVTLDKMRESIRSLLKGRFAHWATRQPDANVQRIGGFLWSVVAGLLASQSLIFAKSTVKLFTAQTQHPDSHQFASFISVFIIFLLVFTAVAQIWCLNRGLAVADSTVVVPSMFAIYSGFGFSNSLFYLDNLDVYSKTITAMICLSLVVLLIGVGILSSKKVEGPLQKPRPDLEGTPGQEPEDEVAVARQRGGHHEDDDHGSAFGEGAKSKLQDAVNSIHFTRSPDHKSRKGAQLLSKGVDQREDEHEMQELPTLYSIDSKRPSDVGKSPFDDPENVFADPDPNRRRRGSFASLDSKDDGGDDFGGFVGAKDGR